jgi:DNA-binding response OmpR family regulator
MIDCKRLLYIDDEQELLDLARFFFEDEDIQVDTSLTLREAARLLETHRYDVIISDVSLPDGNGIKFVSEYKRRGDFHGLFMAVTGDLEAARPEAEGSPDLTLHKPLQFDVLVDQVLALIHKNSNKTGQ